MQMVASPLYGVEEEDVARICSFPWLINKDMFKQPGRVVFADEKREDMVLAKEVYKNV